MPRKPKPYLRRGWYCTDSGGVHRKLCPESEGLAAAGRLLDASPSPPRQLTVAAAAELYAHHADTYYTGHDGRPTREPAKCRAALAHLAAVAGSVPVGRLTRRHVEDTRARMVELGWNRRTINQAVARIKRAVGWLADEGHVPDTVAASVSRLKHLKRFRGGVPEPEPVEPVGWETVEATLPKLREPWRSLVLLQWWSGLRPGEACGLWVGAVETTGDPATPAVLDFGRRHKTGWHGHTKRVPLGPRAWEVLAPWVDGAREAGRDAVFVCRGEVKAPRETSYAKAVQTACGRAGVGPWAPNQIRHAYATRVRAAFGLDAAQVALGHAGADVTQVYAERDQAAAAKVAAALG
jgi:integrase